MASATPQSALDKIDSILSGSNNEVGEEEIVDVEDEVNESENDTQADSVENTDQPDEGSTDDQELTEDFLLNDEDIKDYMMEVNGQKLSLKEIKDGFMMRSDYTKKTTEVARMRVEAEELARTAETKADSLVKQRFEMVALDVEKRLTQYQGIDWKSLARQNPGEYTALQAEYNETVNEAQTLQREYYALAERQKAVTQEQLVETAKRTAEVLSQEIPNWGSALYQEMSEYAISQGLSQEIVANIADEGSLRMIYKAMQFDKTSKQIKSNTKEKITPSVKKVLKTGSKVDVSEEDNKVRTKAKLLSNIKNAKSKSDKNLSGAELIQARLDGRI